MSTETLLRKIIADLAQDPQYADLLIGTCPAKQLIYLNTLIEICCHWIQSEASTVCMQGGIYIALLYPRLSRRQRKMVIQALLPLLDPQTPSFRLDAAAYALQYCRARPVLAAFKKLLELPTASEETRNNAYFAAGKLRRKNNGDIRDI